ncbi:hypothetical protein EGW08_016811, partial [Elysia chlorotica]
LVCPYCLGEGFKSLESLELHLTSVHSVKPTEVYTCNYCNAPYPNLYSLHDHMTVVHRSQHGLDITYPCSMCVQRFHSLDALAKHKGIKMAGKDKDSKHHGSKTNSSSTFSASPKKQAKLSQELSRGEGPVALTVPKEQEMPAPTNGTSQFLENASLLNSHSLMSTMTEGLTCHECNATFHDPQNYAAHMALHSSASDKAGHECFQCGASFASEEQLEAHASLHYLCVSTEYGCSSCLKNFAKPDELQKHLMDIHAHHLYRCSLCKDIFDSKVNIQVIFLSYVDSLTINTFLDSFGNSYNSIILSDTENYRIQLIFCSLVELQCHLTSHSKQFRCPMCDQAFHIEYLLDRHMQNCHGDQKPEINHSLGSGLKSPQPGKTPNPATMFGASAQESISLTSPPASVSAIWKNTEPLHTCNICDVKFCNLGLLNLHKMQDHGVKPPASTASTTSPTTTPLSCMFCSQTFKSSSEYNKHMKIHINSGNLTCSICDETFTSPGVLAEHKLLHCKIQQGNTCVVCRATLSNQEQFFLHAQEHGFDGTLVQCVICRQTLSSLTELQMHGRHHFQARPSFFTCCVCLKSFESRENLVSKLNASGRTYYVCKPCYHGEAPLHTCSQCSEKFATAQLLEAHVQTHKQATFQCIKCQQSFSSEREIQLHVASHVLTEGTQHECRLCGAMFDSPARLQTHLIQHSFVGRDIACHVCGKIFDSPQEIQVHALEHGAPYRRYSCGMCAHTFFFSAELDNHKLIYNHGANAVTKDAERDVGHGVRNTPVSGIMSLPSRSSASSPLLPPPGFSIPTSSLLSSPAALSMATLASFISSSSSLLKPPDNGDGPTQKKLPDGYPFSPASMILPSPSNSSLLASQLFTKGPSGLLSPPGNLLAEHYQLPLSLSAAAESSLSSLTGHGALQCPECSKHFSTGTALANHRKTHWKKDTHYIRCSMCAETFSSATSMQEHFFAVHSDPGHSRKKKNFKCMMCEKECSTLSALQNHILSHRTGGSLPCSICKRTFTSQRYLNLHMRVHKTEDTDNSKVHTETRSGSHKDFTKADEMRAQPDDATDKPPDLACPVCGDTFTSTAEIDEHLKTHE